MAQYLFDTNTLSDFFNSQSENGKLIRKRTSQLFNEDKIYISTISLHELYYGYHKASDKQIKKDRLKVIENIKSLFGILDLGSETASLFGRLKSDLVDFKSLNKNSAKKHFADTLLTACAITEDLTLVSADKVYQDLQELDSTFKWEDWTKV